MEIKKTLIIGAKVLAAVVAGAAVFIGLSKATTKSQIQNPERPGDLTKPERREPTNIDSNSQEVQSNTKMDKVITGFRKFQDICGKLFNVTQSFTIMIENLSRIFGSNSNYEQGMGTAYGCGCRGFTRISPNIIEAGYNPNGVYYGKYRY